MDIKLKKELRSISLTDNTDICALYFGEFGESYSNVADKRKLIYKLPLQIWSRNVLESIQSIGHKNILNFTQIFYTDAIYAISDYEEYPLQKVIHDGQGPLSSHDIGDFLLQIVEGVNCLHELNIFHSYLNPKDIFLKHLSQIKIGGFYFSEILSSSDSVSSHLTRPLYYECNPEEKRCLGLKYDCWCIGLILYEFCFKQPASDLLSAQLNTNWNHTLPKLSGELKGAFRDIYKMLLKYDFNERPNLTELNKSYLDHLRYNRDNHNLGSELGKYKVEEILNVNKSTLKVFDGSVHRVLKLRNAYDAMIDIGREIEILKDNQNKYVITYIENFRFNNYICIVTEYSNERSLKDYIDGLKNNKNQAFDPSVLYSWIKQLIIGLRVMHSMEILHRNIKPSNIIITESPEGYLLKYTDFNVARQVSIADDVPMSRNLKISEYSAPEFILQNDYNKSVDVWSLGCILFEMITLRKVYSSPSEVHHDPPQLDNGSIYKQLVARMLVKIPKGRASAEECYAIIESLRFS